MGGPGSEAAATSVCITAAHTCPVCSEGPSRSQAVRCLRIYQRKSLLPLFFSPGLRNIPPFPNKADLWGLGWAPNQLLGLAPACQACLL